MCFLQQRISQLSHSYLAGGVMERSVAVKVLCCPGRAKQASSCWDPHPNSLSSYLPLVYRPFAERCVLWDSHEVGAPSAACPKQDASLEFQPWEGMATRQQCIGRLGGEGDT